MATFHGTTGDNTRTGTTGNDIFQFAQGGQDYMDGDAGNDIFKLGGALSLGDTILGGTGVDRLYLNGDYSAGFTFGDDALSSVEHIRVSGAHDYSLTTNDSNIAAGEMLTVHADALGAGYGLTFNGGAETDGRFTFYGSDGDDDVTGGARSDTFWLGQGGTDSASGGGGKDVFLLGGNFDPNDSIDGGGGFDKVVLASLNFDDVIVFQPDTLTNVEDIVLGSTWSYGITTDDATVASGKTLIVDGSATFFLNFDGTAETDGHFAFVGGSSGGAQSFTGGNQSDTFDLTMDSDHTVDSRGGDDHFDFGTTLDNNDSINGGGGYDTITLTGVALGDALVLASSTLINVEEIDLLAGWTASLITHNNTVASGASLTVDGSATTSGFGFDGSAETDGSFIVLGGSGGMFAVGGGKDDRFTSNGGAMSVEGGGGADDITCGSGVDTLAYSAVSQSNSTGLAFDVVHGFDAASDRFDMPFAIGSVSSVTHSVSAATFDTNMGEAISDAVCVVVTALGGDLTGHVYLFVDGLGGGGGYNPGADYIIEITGYTGPITTANFI